MKPQNGYTLIQMLVAIVMVGILSALAIHPLKGYYQRIRLQNAANGVKQILFNARSRAISDPLRHCGVYFGVTGDSVRAFFDTDSPSAYTYVAGKDSSYLQALKFTNGITLSIPSGGYPVSVIFRGDGSAKTSGKVLLTLNNFVDTVSVLASTGRIRVGVK